ncbi:MAG: D-alanyl-D-alanine carboxypeptidase/D-alanyl-D-alanine endopeptidase [Planctomycetota bacterium]|jgi:PBP4 family serine-type D-alanyl-D-alanine carboxypeptidase
MTIFAFLLAPALLLLPQVDRIDALLARNELKGARVAVTVMDVESGERLYARNIDEPMAPASNQKLLTTATTLTLLGPDAVLSTRLLSASRPGADGILSGDLLVVGGGDPCLRADVLASRDETDPAALLAELVHRTGITRIDGRLLLDDGLFDREWVHEDWTAGDVANSYAAPIGALSIHGNCLRVAVEGSSSPSAWLMTRAIDYTVKQDVRLADKSNVYKVGAIRPDADGVVRVSGEIGRAIDRREIDVPVRNPTELFGRCLLAHLDALGITITGGAAVAAGAADALRDPVVLGSIETPLGNAIVLANKESDNSVSDHLFKLAGARAGNDGSFSGGARAVADFLTNAVGTSVEGLRMRDGSGLSARNRVTARQLCDTLVAMARAPELVRDAFLRSLPVAGLDGSLDERLTDAPYYGSVRAKTGYISGVSALSGYARTESGRTLAFSIMINEYQSKYSNRQMKAIQDDICRTLVDRW